MLEDITATLTLLERSENLIEVFPEINSKGYSISRSPTPHFDIESRQIFIPEQLNSFEDLLTVLHEIGHSFIDSEESINFQTLLINKLKQKFKAEDYATLCELVANRECSAWLFAIGEGLSRVTKKYPNVKLARLSIHTKLVIKESFYSYTTSVAEVIGLNTDGVASILSEGIFDEVYGQLESAIEEV